MYGLLLIIRTHIHPMPGGIGLYFDPYMSGGGNSPAFYLYQTQFLLCSQVTSIQT